MTFDMPTRGTWEARAGWVVRALMRDLGLQIYQAAGFIGNPGYESRGFTKLQEIRPQVQGSAGGSGWSQWTGMQAPNGRRYRFEKWCRDHGLDTKSDESNYGFMVFELQDASKAGYAWFLARLKKTTTIEDACHLTHEWYERPQEVIDGSFASGPERMEWAQRALTGAQAIGDNPIEIGPSEPVPDDPAGDDLASAAVMNIQLGLRLSGDYDGPIDGIAGRQTTAAVDAFLVRLASQ